MRKAAIRRILFLILISLLLPVPTSAHAGGTDENGGHFDSETGEYHYHHGYEAHQHYDMDGDGDLDCPYNFVDLSGTRSGSSSGSSSGASSKGSTSSSSSSYDTFTRYNATRPKETQPETQPKETSPKSSVSDLDFLPSWVFYVFIFLCISAAIMVYVIYRKDKQVDYYIDRLSNEQIAAKKQLRETKERMDKEHHEQLSAVQEDLRVARRDAQDLQEKVNTLQKDLERSSNIISQYKAMQAISERINLSDLHIPDNIRFLADGKPVSGDVTPERPYGDMTVYISEKGTAFHAKSSCSGHSLKPAYVYDVVGQKSPCFRCAWPYSREIPPWYQKVMVLSDMLNPEKTANSTTTQGR